LRLPDVMAEHEPGLRFDAVIGRRALSRETEKVRATQVLGALLAEDGLISLAEPIPRRAQRLYALVDASALPPEVVEQWKQAEEATYAASDDPLVNWDAADLANAMRAAGLRVYASHVESTASEYLLSARHLVDWFTPASTGRPSYLDHLSRMLDQETIEQIRRLLERQLVGQTCTWRSSVVYLVAGQDTQRRERSTS
jgi:putative ATPase